MEIAAYHGHPVPSIADGIVGATLLICGMLAWRLQSARAVGALMLLTGGTWLLGTLVPAALLLHRGPLVHLHISYPTGRLRRPLAIVTVAVAYVTAIVEPWARNDWLTLAVAVLIAAAAVDVFVRTSGPARKAGRPALAAALAFAGVLALGAIDRLAGWGAGLAMLLLYDTVVAAVAIVLLLDLRFGRWVDATVADLVIGLGGEASASLQAQLRRAMGDPSAVVGYWAPEIGSYVDDAGTPLRLPADPRTRVVTYVEDNGAPLAALVHDPAVARDPELLTAVSAAARLAVTNVRLRAGIRDRATRLAASRRRIVEAADRQRRDLETELAAGTVDRLATVARLLDAADVDGVDDIKAELEDARTDLVDFAHGVRPAALTAGGLGAALPLLANRSPVPVALTVRIDRAPAAVEACVYFVCAEALTNVIKHASATRVDIEVSLRDDQVRTSVTDDGTGGANLLSGTGLRGLADRVEALGGTLTVSSGRGDGTTVVATVPAG
ncbi:MAG TPA: ATP-binding protein [Micropruina sp.]|nr:ATP-binding protein [Micropruina sp.]